MGLHTGLALQANDAPAARWAFRGYSVVSLALGGKLADRNAEAALEDVDPREVDCPNPECDGTVDAQRVITGGFESACCGSTYAELRDAATADQEEEREPMEDAYQFEVES